MPTYRYRLLNVFAPSPLAGNPLCVFEDARGMSDELMQALAIQFNLSETTFLLPSDRASARIRIFSPGGEFPFAGHPTLGSACVARALHRCGDRLTLETKAGVIPVRCDGDVYTLRANTPTWRPVQGDAKGIADLLHLAPEQVVGPVLWVDTGFEQMVVPLRDDDALMQARVEAQSAEGFLNGLGFAKIYLWTRPAAAQVRARFFFSRGAGQIGEDPGTGSACANLGGWMIATGAPRPLALTVHQGDHLGRPCRLRLEVDAAGSIAVGGNVLEIGQGSITL